MIVPPKPTVQSVSESSVPESSVPESSVSKPAESEPFIPKPLRTEDHSELPSVFRADGSNLALNTNERTVINESEVFPLNALSLDAASLDRSTEDRSTESVTLGIKTEIQIFLSTFLTIFLAEIGDKTQLTILLMSAESQSPWLIFLGAGLALIATSLCGVLLGKWLSTRISPKALDTSAGLLLIFISTLLTWDFFQG